MGGRRGRKRTRHWENRLDRLLEHSLLSHRACARDMRLSLLGPGFFFLCSTRKEAVEPLPY